MRKDYLERIKSENGWFWDNDKKYLAISDDLDSLLSALLILKYRPSWEIGFFVDFREGIYRNLLLDEDISIYDNNVIGVDWSVPKFLFKCISNHLCQVKNENINTSDINLNIIDGVNMSKNKFDYHKKYNLSTFLLVASLMDHQFTSEGAKVLSLLPDSSFLGYFANKNFQDYDIQKKYLDILGYKDIWECQSRYSLEEFRRFQDYWKISSKVGVDDEGITTVQEVDLHKICKLLEIDVDLLDKLKGLFGLVIRTASNRNSVYRGINKQKCWSFAVTSKDYYVYSVEV